MSSVLTLPAWRGALVSHSRCHKAFQSILWIDSQDPAKATAFAKAAYRLYWLEGRSTTDERAAADAAASIGLDRDALLSAIQQGSVKEQFIRENDRAITKGVFGSPFFLVDGEPFWGTEWIESLSTPGQIPLA